MELYEILEVFYQKMAEIQYYRISIKDLTKAEISKLSSIDNGLPRDVPTSFQNMAFTNPYSGKAQFYGKSQHTVDERIKHILLHRNKQYCWLLAEAYELFEDYLIRVYAYLGKNDINYWTMSEFGNISIDEAKKKEFKWFFEKASKKKDIPYSIWNAIKKKYGNIDIRLKSNTLKINLDFIFYLIHFMRHQIVHLSGRVTNKIDFYTKVFKKSGVYNNGNAPVPYVKMLDMYFGSGDYGNVIMLIEEQIGNSILEHNKLAQLLNDLTAIAYIIYFEISEQLDPESSSG